MKKLFAAMAVLLVLLSGCSASVSKKEYDEVVAENISLKHEISTMELELKNLKQESTDRAGEDFDQQFNKACFASLQEDIQGDSEVFVSGKDFFVTAKWEREDFYGQYGMDEDTLNKFGQTAYIGMSLLNMSEEKAQVCYIVFYDSEGVYLVISIDSEGMGKLESVSD